MGRAQLRGSHPKRAYTAKAIAGFIGWLDSATSRLNASRVARLWALSTAAPSPQTLGHCCCARADRAINLTPQVARCFRDARDPDSVVHTIETLIAQRIHGQALGYEDVNDHNELRHDPILARTPTR
jgi:hypothetical protein